MKSVLMIYPITPYTDYNSRFAKAKSVRVDLIQAGWQILLGIDPKDSRDRFRLINVLLDRYRNNGYKIGWAFFSRPENPTEPDLNLKSDIFDIKSTDYILPTGITLHEHTYQNLYPDEQKVLLGISGLSELVVGGFFEDDCIKRFVQAAKDASIDAKIDELLTDTFFFRIADTFGHDMYEYLITKGNWTREFHEDDPYTEKCRLLDNRLDEQLREFLP